MPIVDKPLEELKIYQGSSPCPADIDQYWDDALAEMNAIDPQTKFEKVDFKAKGIECYHLWFTGTKGAVIHAKFIKPEKIEGKTAAILNFHGLGCSSQAWSDYFAYVSQGYCVAALDSRGQGGLSEDAGKTQGPTYTTFFMRGIDGDKHDLYTREIFLDTALLAKIVMGLDYVDETRIGVYGGSQGGALSLACAALVPEIKKCAPAYPYHCDYKRVWEMDLNKDAYEGMKYYFRRFDPTHEREDEVWEKLGYIDLQNITKRIKAEVMMSTGLMDTICPPSTQFAAYNKITSKKRVIIYPEFGHEDLVGHNDKLFEFFSDL